jgi:hypothetical protein
MTEEIVGNLCAFFVLVTMCVLGVIKYDIVCENEMLARMPVLHSLDAAQLVCKYIFLMLCCSFGLCVPLGDQMIALSASLGILPLVAKFTCILHLCILSASA